MSSQPATDSVILDPSGEGIAETNSIAERLGGLEGKTIGLLDNCKTNANVFLNEVGEILQAEYGVEAVVSRRKDKSSIPAGDIISYLVKRCDAVVNAYGDCGSCTSWTVHDSIELEMQGVPTATVESEEFVKLGQSETQSLGMPGLPFVTVPHPMGSVEEEVARERSHDAMAQIEKLLTIDRQVLEEEYTNKFLSEDEDVKSGDDLSCPL
jgi:hypothetical protein